MLIEPAGRHARVAPNPPLQLTSGEHRPPEGGTLSAPLAAERHNVRQRKAMYRRVCLSPDLVEAELIWGLLHAAGYHPDEFRTLGHVWDIGADQAYFIQVPAEEAEDARRFLADNGYTKQLV